MVGYKAMSKIHLQKSCIGLTPQNLINILSDETGVYSLETCFDLARMLELMIPDKIILRVQALKAESIQHIIQQNMNECVIESKEMTVELAKQVAPKLFEGGNDSFRLAVKIFENKLNLKSDCN